MVPIDKLSVVIVAFFGAALLGKHLPVRGWISVALIGGGALLVATA